MAKKSKGHLDPVNRVERSEGSTLDGAPAPYTYLENTPLANMRPEKPSGLSTELSKEQRALAKDAITPRDAPNATEFADEQLIELPATHHRVPRPLISALELHALSDLPELRVIDLRWYLQNKRGADEYANGHLPGAIFLDLVHDLSASAGPGRHPIPGPEQFAKTMARIGVTPKTHLVVYDDASGSIAARLWWICKLYGHKRVSILDGGLPAWLRAGFPLSTEVPLFAPTEYTINQPRLKRMVVDKWDVDLLRTKKKHLLFDARIPERYRGEVEPIDARPGHILGALNAPFTANLEEGKFKSAEELQAHYKALGVKKKSKVTVYCGSGVTACHNILALSLAFPEKKVTLYEGSWSDWAKDSDRPIATGD
jgi:thiosulfate/3-mercaptopyruvate sulfurtransferase